MPITSDQTIGELVADDARRTRVFETLGIDYCCGGRRTLADACRERDLDADTVAAMLDAVAGARSSADSTQWNKAPLGALIDHIEDTHHAFLRRELPRLEMLLSKVARVHGDQAPWMVRVKEAFDTLKPELMDHMLKEEETVFPFIRALANGDSVSTPTELGDDPIRLMEEEHEFAGETLATMHELTDGFTPPEWACGTFRAALSGLADLEADTHQHVHKENNILFARAREMAVQ